MNGNFTHSTTRETKVDSQASSKLFSKVREVCISLWNLENGTDSPGHWATQFGLYLEPIKANTHVPDISFTKLVLEKLPESTIKVFIPFVQRINMENKRTAVK